MKDPFKCNMTYIIFHLTHVRQLKVTQRYLEDENELIFFFITIIFHILRTYQVDFWNKIDFLKVNEG